MVEGDTGLVDDDVTEGRAWFMIKAPLIMMAHSAYPVYAVCNIQVLGKESHAQTTSRTMRKEVG